MIISVLNEKGGTGKTTISLNLAKYYSQDQPTRIIDCDFQSNSKYIVGISGIDWPDTHWVETTGELDRVVKDTESEIVIIDSPPMISKLSLHIISISDIILIPFTPSELDILTTMRICKLINTKKKKGFLVLNKKMKGTKMPNSFVDNVEACKIPMLKSTLHHRVAFQRSLAEGLSVLESNDLKAKEEMINLAKEIVEEYNK